VLLLCLTSILNLSGLGAWPYQECKNFSQHSYLGHWNTQSPPPRKCDSTRWAFSQEPLGHLQPKLIENILGDCEFKCVQIKGMDLLNRSKENNYALWSPNVIIVF